jgi:GT2 family glycosyltransferase
MKILSNPDNRMPLPKVYIVILNFKQWEDTRDCLESVLQSTYNNFSVFVIDNNSGNNSLKYLSAWLETRMAGKPSLQQQPVQYVLLTRQELNESTDFSKLPGVVFIQNDENAGFAAGNNVVLRILRNKEVYFWLLNPDMVIKEDALEKLVQFTSGLSFRSIVGAIVRSYSGNHELLFYGGHKVNFLSATVRMVKQKSAVQRLDYISGACLFTHASNLEQLGLLPEEYFLYWEETDWCYRAKRSGYVLAVCPEAVCYDKISTIIGKSFMADYYYVRNGLRFISKFRKKNIPVVLFFIGIRFWKRIFTGQWARARGVFKGTRDFFKMKPDETK